MDNSKKNSSKSQVRDRIINEFKKYFDYFGYDKTAVEDIAEELKISKKTIYSYFNSKDDIYARVIKDSSKDYESSINQKIAAGKTSFEKIQLLINEYQAYANRWDDKNQGLAFRFKQENARKAFIEAIKTVLDEVINSGVSKGEFSVVNKEMAIKVVLSIIEKTSGSQANPPMSTEDAISTIIKLLG